MPEHAHEAAAPQPQVPQKPMEQLLGELRPRLHRYCARMTGSVIDGEDVVQETMLKAIEAAPAVSIANPEGWLFRIAHHAALDFLRRRAREEALCSSEEPDMIAAARNPVDDRQMAAASLRTFMRLPVSQRSSVLLSDVLGHSLQEIREIIGGSVPSIKAALQRGRNRLRTFAAETDDDAPVPVLAEPERTRLTTYVERFNAHDFDAVRAMLADDVRLELVNRLRLDGKKNVAPYFTNYAVRPHWRFIPGFVDRRPAMLVYDTDDPHPRVKYFVLLDWAGDRVAGIRDFVFARYAMDGAEIAVME